MKITTLAALLAALIAPMAASAQVAQPPPAAQVQPARVSNPGQHAYHHWMKRLSALGLSAQQQQQAQSILNQYAAQHPAGSPRNPGAARALHDQIFGILTPAQQSQLEAEIKAQQQAEQQRRMQMQQQQGAPPPPPNR
jgi:opacity protein-like surface antigen